MSKKLTFREKRERVKKLRESIHCVQTYLDNTTVTDARCIIFMQNKFNEAVDDCGHANITNCEDIIEIRAKFTDILNDL